MRHAAVAYFGADGLPSIRRTVRSRPKEGEQATMAGRALAGVELDRVITSGLARTVETAQIVAPGREPETWPAFEELRPGRLADIDEDGLEAAFAGAFAGTITADTRFLGGETIGELMKRVVPAFESLVADQAWDTALAVLHGGVNRAILSYALTGELVFFGGFEQAPACINVLDVDDARAVDRPRREQRRAPRRHRAPAVDDDGGVLRRVSVSSRSRNGKRARRTVRAPRASARDPVR